MGKLILTNKEATMPKFKVFAERVETLYTIVEADSWEDAEEIADTSFDKYQWNEVDGSMTTAVLVQTSEPL